jgi:hypothetical protein
MVTPKIRDLGQRIATALNAFAEARMRNAVPEWQLRKADREIDRVGRMMHARRLSHGGRKGHAEHRRPVVTGKHLDR